MNKKAFDKLTEALTEAFAVARGEAEPARLHAPEPARLQAPDDIDVRAIRSKAAMSQEDFAAAFGFSINEIRGWEQGRTRPIGESARLSQIIDADPGKVRDARGGEGAAGGVKRVHQPDCARTFLGPIVFDGADLKRDHAGLDRELREGRELHRAMAGP